MPDFNAVMGISPQTAAAIGGPAQPFDLTPAGADPSEWGDAGVRADGSAKGNGFLGVFGNPNGTVTSEYSIADSEKLKDAKGNYLEYPSLVPTLSKAEVLAVLKAANHGTPLPDSVYDKAEAHALQRQKQGKPLFAGPGEERFDLYPEIPRLPIIGSTANSPAAQRYNAALQASQQP